MTIIARQRAVNYGKGVVACTYDELIGRLFLYAIQCHQLTNGSSTAAEISKHSYSNCLPA